MDQNPCLANLVGYPGRFKQKNVSLQKWSWNTSRLALSHPEREYLSICLINYITQWHHMAVSQKKGTPKTLLVKEKINQKLWSLGSAFFLTHCHMSSFSLPLTLGLGQDPSWGKLSPRVAWMCGGYVVYVFFLVFLPLIFVFHVFCFNLNMFPFLFLLLLLLLACFSSFSSSICSSFSSFYHMVLPFF